MFVQELDRPAYLVVPTRGFFDKELGLTADQEQALLRLQDEANELQMFLREVYHAGDNSRKVQAPPWLVRLVGGRLAPRVFDPDSSKTLRLKPNKTGSSSNTSPTE